MFILTVFSTEDVMNSFKYILLRCMVCMVSGVRFREADTYMLYLLMFNCRGGGWYVMCAKSVAVTLLCVHSFDKNFVFLSF